jgi:hypothetical protein
VDLDPLEKELRNAERHQEYDTSHELCVDLVSQGAWRPIADAVVRRWGLILAENTPVSAQVALSRLTANLLRLYVPLVSRGAVSPLRAYISCLEIWWPTGWEEWLTGYRSRSEFPDGAWMQPWERPFVVYLDRRVGKHTVRIFPPQFEEPSVPDDPPGCLSTLGGALIFADAGVCPPLPEVPMERSNENGRSWRPWPPADEG